MVTYLWKNFEVPESNNMIFLPPVPTYLIAQYSRLFKKQLPKPNTCLLFLLRTQFFNAWIALVNSEICHRFDTRYFWKKNCRSIFFYIPYAKITQRNKRYQLENLFSMRIAKWWASFINMLKTCLYKNDVNFTNFQS